MAEKKILPPPTVAVTEENPNLRIWSRVDKTDPEYTHDYSGPGGFTGTALNPTYLIKRATEVFGPAGIGWGWEVIEERYDTGAPLSTKDGVIVDENGMTLRAVTHTLRLAVWYKLDGETGRVEVFGHTPFVYANKWGPQTDGEAPKKSLTDAIKKGLSMLGFAADVFMGQYDDFDYRAQVQNEFAVVKADDKDAELERQAAEFREWYDKQKSLLGSAVSLNELAQVYKIAVRMLKRRGDDKRILELTKIKDQRKKALENNEKSRNTQPKGEQNNG